MSKNPVNKKYLQKIIDTTQNIEGYKNASADVVKKVHTIREKYGIKVSAQR